MKITFPKGTREAIDKATAPLDQRLEVLERRLTQLEDDHAYKGMWNGDSLVRSRRTRHPQERQMDRDASERGSMPRHDGRLATPRKLTDPWPSTWCSRHPRGGGRRGRVVDRGRDVKLSLMRVEELYERAFVCRLLQNPLMVRRSKTALRIAFSPIHGCGYEDHYQKSHGNH
jgi:hypothetical protein